MLELTEIPQTARERLEEVGASDLVIGVFAPFTPEALDDLARRWGTLLAGVHARSVPGIEHPAIAIAASNKVGRTGFM